MDSNGRGAGVPTVSNGLTMCMCDEKHVRITGSELRRTSTDAAVVDPDGHDELLAELKARVRATQFCANAANTEVLRLYWSIDREILDRHATGGRAARSSDSELAQHLVMDPYVLKHLGFVQRQAERAVEQALMGRRQRLPREGRPPPTVRTDEDLDDVSSTTGVARRNLASNSSVRSSCRSASSSSER